jgi:hypothetical protein
MKVLAAFGLIIAIAAPGTAAAENDYPTETRADYVFACMKANGETQEMLKRCSCSIDVIASLLPYDRYEAAETAMSLAQARGQIGTMVRSTAEIKAFVADLHRAQAEAEVRCF